MNSPIAPAISMDASGRLVLPKAVRDQLHLKAGARLTAEVVGGRIELTPQDDDCEIVVKDGMPVIRFRRNVKVDAAAAVREDREEQANRALRR